MRGFDGKAEYLDRLASAKERIAEIEAEIDSINADIKEKLYPLERLTLKDRSAVNNIVDRYNALGEYERGKIERWEDVIKTKTKLDNILRGIIIGCVLFVIVTVMTVLLVRRISRRRHRREREMDELARMFEGEE